MATDVQSGWTWSLLLLFQEFKKTRRINIQITDCVAFQKLLIYTLAQVDIVQFFAVDVAEWGLRKVIVVSRKWSETKFLGIFSERFAVNLSLI